MVSYEQITLVLLSRLGGRAVIDSYEWKEHYKERIQVTKDGVCLVLQIASDEASTLTPSEDPIGEE